MIYDPVIYCRFLCGCYFVSPLGCFIVHQNWFPYLQPFTSWVNILIYRLMRILIHQSELIIHSKNIYLLDSRFIHCLVNCHLGLNSMNCVTEITISTQCLNSSWDLFILDSLYQIFHRLKTLYFEDYCLILYNQKFKVL